MKNESKEKDDILSRFEDAVNKNEFVKFTFGKYRGNEEQLENLYLEPVLIHDEVQYSGRFKYKTKDVFKNYSFQFARELANEILGTEFLFGALYTTSADVIIEYNKKREPRLFTRKATFTRSEIKSHNKVKPRFVNSKAKYLSLLGITGPKGEVKNDKYYKFRQIDKFIEIVDSLYRESSLKDKENLKILDLGSGKSYLTFALYDYFNNKLGVKADVKGIEQRSELVDFSNQAAEDCKYFNLVFTKGTIQDLQPGKVDIVAALHACDTATDDAIVKAIKTDAEIIILAPCCQKYVRNQIEIPHNLKSIFHHGILEEHISSFITDGLRSLMLEAYGYKTKVFEFISQEHTSKNIMITAVKTVHDTNYREQKLLEIESIKSQFGLKDFYLDTIIKK